MAESAARQLQKSPDSAIKMVESICHALDEPLGEIQTTVDEEVFKARYFACGFNDIGKYHLIHDSPVSTAENTRMILSLAAIFGFRISSSDVTQAYIQSTHNLTRNVFINPTG
jgi:hypothetical protein